jgi:hypothetical protein
MNHSQERLQKISMVTTVVLTFFVINVIFYYFNGAFRLKEFPLNTFLTHPISRFGDFYGVHDEWSRQKFTKAGYGLLYFPATYLFIDPLSWLKTPQRGLAVLETIFLSFFFIYSLMKLRTRDGWQNWRNAVVMTFMSYPVLFAWATGNIEAVVFMLMAVHVELFRRGNYRWSTVPLGFAVAMKVFPLVFLMLYVARRRYRDCLLVLATAVVATVIPLLVFEGGLLDPEGLYFENLRKSQQMYMDLMVNGPSGVHFGHSIINGVRAWMGDKFPSMELIKGPYMVFAIGTFALLASYLFRTRPPLWKTMTLLVVAIDLLPYTSTDYKLLHFFIPLYLFINHEEEEGASAGRLRWIILWLFVLLLVPKSFHYFNRSPLLTLNVVLNPCLMIALAAAVILSHRPERIHESYPGYWLLYRPLRLRNLFSRGSPASPGKPAS